MTYVMGIICPVYVVHIIIFLIKSQALITQPAIFRGFSGINFITIDQQIS